MRGAAGQEFDRETQLKPESPAGHLCDHGGQFDVVAVCKHLLCALQVHPTLQMHRSKVVPFNPSGSILRHDGICMHHRSMIGVGHVNLRSLRY